MVLVVTYIELRSPLKFFALSYNALGIMGDLKKTPCVAHKNTGIWTKHYTMTLWNNHEEMRAFARSGAHLASMKKSAQLANEIRTLTIEADGLLPWKEAKERVFKEGRVFAYNK